MHQARYTLGGFTLIELIIAMVITSVLLMISLPAYQQQLVRARRALARAELQEVAMRQEQYFLDHRRYASSLRDLGYPDDPMVLDEQGNNLPDSEGGIYRIEMSMLNDVYTVTPRLTGPTPVTRVVAGSVSARWESRVSPAVAH